MALASGQLNEHGEQIALEAIFRRTQSAAAGSIWLALITAAPNATDLTMAALTEFSTADGYARQVFGPGSATAASPSVISNAGTITYGPITTAAPGTCTWAVLTDAVSGTTSLVLASFLLANARTPLVGDSLTAAASAFTCQLLQET